MSSPRIGIVGAGPMGRLHALVVARSAANGAGGRLVGITDHHPGRAAAVADELGVEAFEDPEALIQAVDAVVVAVPTSAHHDVAAPLLERGVDLLIEKPLAASLGEGERLVERARANARILQVGHVEWYNPAWREALGRVGSIRSIDVERLNPPAARGLDVDVVADLMLHDLDWISRGVGEEIDEVRATGRVGEAGRLDEAEAQLHFCSGCTARLVVSRTHSARRRFVRIEGSRGTATADLLSGVVRSELGEGGPTLSGEAPDPLGAQWRDFLAATRQRTQPVNDGAVGLAALRLVERVRAAIGIGRPGAEAEAGGARDDDSHLRR